jgi:hypothetical protein
MPIKVPAAERGYDKPERSAANREFGREFSDALRGTVAARKAERRESADPHGKIPTSAPINGVDPDTQAERAARAAVHEAEAPSMSDILRGIRRSATGGKTTNEILAEQTRGKRR